MIVLVPVSKFRVVYETARGRPYSKLEHMVLQTVAEGEGGVTLKALSRAFRVHQRLLIEAVVTLVTAGWVAVAGGPEARFALTAVGHEAARSGRDPVSVVVSPARPQTVVMDRVTGQLARNSDARSWRRDELGDTWYTVTAMRERIERNSLDEAQVQKLLPRQTGEWVRRVGPIILTSRATHFLAADVDLDTGLVRGLPPAWQEALNGRVLACARARREPDESTYDETAPRPAATTTAGRRGRRFSGVPEPTRGPSARTTRLRLDRSDLAVGVEEHEEALRLALAVARSSVAVVSPSVSSVEVFARLAGLAADAVRRGIRVDVLVGSTNEGVGTPELLTIAKRVGYEADRQDGRSLLRTRHPATGSGASLLLYDNQEGHLVGLLGDYEWLNGPARPRQPLGARLTEASLCGDLARAVGSLWLGSTRLDPDLAGSAERWRRLADAAEEHAALLEAARRTMAPADETFVELLVDDENAGLGQDRDGLALVGGHFSDPGAGEAGARGLTLRVTGPGAAVIAEARAGA